MSHYPNHRGGGHSNKDDDQFAEPERTPTVSEAPTRADDKPGPGELNTAPGEFFNPREERLFSDPWRALGLFSGSNVGKDLLSGGIKGAGEGVFQVGGDIASTVAGRISQGYEQLKEGRQQLGEEAPFLYSFPWNPWSGLSDPEPVQTLGSAWYEETQERQRQELENGLARREQIELIDTTTMPQHVREQWDELKATTDAEIETITADIDQLTRLEEGYAEAREFSQQIMDQYGVAGSVDAARTDPAVAKAFDAVSASVAADGEGLEEALDLLDELTIAQRGKLTTGIEGDEMAQEINNQIRISMNNLVENRQIVKDKALADQDWAMKEARAQQQDPWDTFGDNSAEGRGLDVLVGLMNPFFDGKFQGILKRPQNDDLTALMSSVWENLPSQVEQVDESGETIKTLTLDPESRNKLDEYGRLVFGFNDAELEEMFSELDYALRRAQEEMNSAENWKTASSFSAGGAGLRTAVNDVAESIYGREGAQQISSSAFLATIINERSGNRVTNYDPSAQGNQYGLGGLPAHTYLALDYTHEMLEDNPEMQLQALFKFLGEKYGPGYEGLQRGFADMLNNDEWGELG